MGDDPDEPPVDARRAVRDPAHHFANVVAKLLERDVGRQQVTAGAEPEECANACHVRCDGESIVAAVHAGQPEIESFEEVAPYVGRLKLRWLLADAFEVLVKAAERGPVGGDGHRRPADQAGQELVLGDGQRDAFVNARRGIDLAQWPDAAGSWLNITVRHTDLGQRFASGIGARVPLSGTERQTWGGATGSSLPGATRTGQARRS